MASSKTDAQTGLLYMFERISEPLFIPKASKTVGFNLPKEIVPSVVDNVAVTNRFGGAATTNINIKFVTSFRDLPLSVRSLKRGAHFSSFIPAHVKAARDLTDLFLKQRTPEDLLNFAANIRDSINETLFIYSLSFVIIRRKDLKGMQLPTFVEMMPQNFIPIPTIAEGQREVNRSKVTSIVKPERVTIEHDLDFSGTAQKLEHRVNYWREDYGINNHHWHWHLIFPPNMGLNRDRKGEIFFYMHTQMLARYDWERLSNGLTRVKGFTTFNETIVDGYFSKLTIDNSSQNYGSRQDNTPIRDFNRRPFVVEPFTVSDLEVWRQRIFDGIHQGFFFNREGERIPLSDDVDILSGSKRGIDILGDAFEADLERSVNAPFYGNLHNLGHVIISSAHDPDGVHKENMSVMGNPATTMRDPAFYKLHKFVDDVFQAYKMTQRPYTDDEMLVEDVEIDKIGLATGREGNVLRTFYDMKIFEASRGIDFGDDAPSVDINITRLNHSPFKYHFLVNNRSRAEKRVTVRVYMAPKFNEAGTEMAFMEQRTLWGEMDKFIHTLRPGINHIQRESTESSITISEELTFRELEAGTAATQESEAFCGCGWPQHMLVPRGTAAGMIFQLFVLISDYELDKVTDTPASKDRCGKAVSYCGLLDERFPDKRPMGYPFDRRNLPEVDTVAALAQRLPNAQMIDITIQFGNAGSN